MTEFEPLVGISMDTVQLFQFLSVISLLSTQYPTLSLDVVIVHRLHPIPTLTNKGRFYSLETFILIYESVRSENLRAIGKVLIVLILIAIV